VSVPEDFARWEDGSRITRIRRFTDQREDVVARHAWDKRPEFALIEESQKSCSLLTI